MPDDSDFAYVPPNATNAYGPPTVDRSMEMNETHRLKRARDVSAITQGIIDAARDMNPPRTAR